MNNKLGTYLKNIRTERGFSLSDVGEKIDVSPSYIFRLEKGERKNPSISIISKLCNFYNLDLSSVLKLAGIEENPLNKEIHSKFDLLQELKLHEKVYINNKEYNSNDIINILSSLTSLKTA